MNKHLVQFLAVAEAGSFVAAAEKLLISQPALTYGIRKLEDRLEVTLFERSSRGVRLTEYGETLYKKAQLMSRLFDNALTSIETLKAEREHGVSIGTGYSTWTLYFKNYLIEHHKRHPNVLINVSIGNNIRCMDLLMAGDIALFVGHQVPNLQREGDVEFIPLGMAPDGFFARPGHPVLAEPRRLSEIFDWPTSMAFPPEMRRSRQQFAETEPREDWFGHIFTSNSLTACIDFVLATDSVLIHSTQLLDFLLSKGLRQIQVCEGEVVPEWLLGIYVMTERRDDPRVQEIIKSIIQFAPKLGLSPYSS